MARGVRKKRHSRDGEDPPSPPFVRGGVERTPQPPLRKGGVESAPPSPPFAGGE